MHLPVLRSVGGPILLSGALLVPAIVGAQHFPPDEDLGVMLRYIVEDTGTPGIVVGLLEADGSTRVVSYGSGGEGRPLGPRSLFEIGSMTKPFVGALLADMVARGEVALDDPVSMYLPDRVTVPSRGEHAITLLHLATHTAGLPFFPPLQRRGPRTLAEFSTEDLYEFLSGHRLRGVPGVGYAYSNLGYGLLGHALARAAGMPLSRLLRERILDPLGMEMTHIPDHGEVHDAMVRGHRRGVPGPYWFASEAMQGAGAMVSNMEEMLTFLRAAVPPPGTDLERAIQAAQEVRIPDGTRGAGWGFSWRTGEFPGGTLLTGQGGATDAFKSRIVISRERGTGVVILANDFCFDEPLEVVLLGHEPLPAGWSDIGVEREVLARHAGVYVDGEGSGPYYVRLEKEGFLSYQTPDRARARLYALSDTTFYTLRGPWTFTMRSAEGGGGTMGMEEDERSRSPDRTVMTARRVGEDAPAPVLVAGSTPAADERRGIGVGSVLIALTVVVLTVLWLRTDAMRSASRARGGRRGSGKLGWADRFKGRSNFRR
jgi:serine-type D-Ala-D-Ala carboxypeptidase/endopeptidase